jgi:hypothetical protein
MFVSFVEWNVLSIYFLICCHAGCFVQGCTLKNDCKGQRGEIKIGEGMKGEAGH